MAFTKSGMALIKQANAAQSTVPPQQAAKPTGVMAGLGRIGSGIGRVANPLLVGGFIGNAVLSGEQSLGESVGETVGGIGGFSLGNRIAQHFIPKGGFWGAAARAAAGMAGASIGSLAGSALGSKVPLYHRQPQTPESYFSGNNQQYQQVQNNSAIN